MSKKLQIKIGPKLCTLNIFRSFVTLIGVTYAIALQYARVVSKIKKLQFTALYILLSAGINYSRKRVMKTIFSLSKSNGLLTFGINGNNQIITCRLGDKHNIINAMCNEETTIFNVS